MKEQNIKKILKSPQTVFSFKELTLLLKTPKIDNLKSQVNYLVSQGDLYHIRRGLYAKSKEYDRLELAIKIFTPAYISFETVLAQAGIIFQYSSNLFIASYQSREVECDGTTYVFRTIKPEILTNSDGIEIRDTYSIATPERAFLDTVYLNTEYHFDNLAPLNWQKIYELLPIYGDNKSMRKRVDTYHHAYQQEMGV